MFDTKFLVIALVASVISLVTFVISVRFMLFAANKYKKQIRTKLHT